jgi:ribosomal protein L31
MAQNIHPKSAELELILTDGSIFTTMSAHGGKLRLDADFLNHPAWTGSLAKVNTNVRSVEKFNKKFGDLFSEDSGN